MPIPLPIKVRREQDKAQSPFAPVAEFDAGMKVEFGVIQIVFSTNPGSKKSGSTYTSTIRPNHFRALAQAMMYANSSEAIKAFGTALEAGIPEIREVWCPGIDDVDAA
jgi:hypothetical protein